jgi:hypothetical protein
MYLTEVKQYYLTKACKRLHQYGKSCNFSSRPGQTMKQDGRSLISIVNGIKNKKYITVFNPSKLENAMPLPKELETTYVNLF